MTPANSICNKINILKFKFKFTKLPFHAANRKSRKTQKSCKKPDVKQKEIKEMVIL